jgi:hypothetical protein
MPLSKIHNKKKYKNYTLLVVLLAVVILFFAITIVKIKYL